MQNRSQKQKARPRQRRLSLEGLEPRCLLAADVYITEFAAQNDSLQDTFGDTSDWIELFNAGTSSADLSDYFLTDDAGELDKWQFPSRALEPGQFATVFASGRDTVVGTEVHTNFGLNAAGDYLALVESDGATVKQDFGAVFPPQTDRATYGLEMQLTGSESILLTTGESTKFVVPTNDALGTTWTDPDFDDAAWSSGTTPIGYENSPGDFANIINTTIPTGSQRAYLRIPFSLSSAGIGGLNLRVRYDDGFAAYINGVRVTDANVPDSLAWNSLATGNHPDPDAVLFEDFDASTGIPGLRTGDNVLSIHGLNVSASSSDFLMDAELRTQAAALVQPLQVGFVAQPTAGFANAETFGGFVDDVAFSAPHGIYESGISLNLSSNTPAATIVYTTDGSTPQVDGILNPTNGTVFTGPLSIDQTSVVRAVAFKEEYVASYPRASTYLFLDDVLTQSNNGQAPAGWPDSNVNGQQLDFGMDPQIINLYGSQAIKEALAEISTISITTDLDNLFAEDSGIYVNANNSGRSWERPASVELFQPDGSTGFQVNAGLRIRGGFSRNDFNPKHAFRFYFRGEYGDGKLDYPLFDDEGVNEFDVLDLRTAQNYSWSSGGSFENTFVREVWSRDMQRDMDHPYTRSRYHHLYLNGVYWGLFQTQERVEEFFAESYLGGDKEDYDVVKSGVRETGGPTEIADGNDEAWRAVFDLAQGLWDNPTSNADNYFTLQGLRPDGTSDPNLPVLLDMDSLIDWMIGIAFTGNRDSGLSDFIGNNISNNWYGVRNREAGNRGFVFFQHDAEHTLGAANTDFNDRTGPYFTSNQDTYAHSNPQYLHQDLMASPEYRLKFADRIQKHFFNGGALTEQHNVERFLARAEEVDPVIIAESARWGDAQVSNPLNKSHWQNEINSVLNGFFPIRNDLVLNQLANDDLWPGETAPDVYPPGGTVSPGSDVFLIGSGDIYYTLDGRDPRTPGGGVLPDAVFYTGPFPIHSDATVKVRSLEAGEWSPLKEASFSLFAVPANAAALRVTEIHYHPAPPTSAELLLAPGTMDSDYEFLEYTNVAGYPLDLAGVTVSQGISYTFGAGTLVSGQSVVVVSNPTAFQARYGDAANVAGQYLMSLSDGGESLTVQAADGSTIQSFTYSDDDLWPKYSDGGGESLWVVDTAGNYNNPNNWLPSQFDHGTPGSHQSPVASDSDLRITEVHYNPGTAFGEEFIEFTNVGAEAVDLTQFEVVEGVQFDFGGSLISTLQPGHSAVIVGNTFAFENYYGSGLPMIGEFASSLSNGGERIIVYDGPRNTRHDFVYDDAAPWPTQADGQGRSIEVVDVDGDYGSASNWKASSVVGGTPGAALVAGDFNLDGELGCQDVNALSAEIVAGSNTPWYDMTGDGSVDYLDLAFWISDLKGTSLGDANLDMLVNAADFNIWNANRFTSSSAYCSGDFNADGGIDLSDLHIWNENRQTTGLTIAPADVRGKRDRVGQKHPDDGPRILFGLEQQSTSIDLAEMAPVSAARFRPLALRPDRWSVSDAREDASQDQGSVKIIGTGDPHRLPMGASGWFLSGNSKWNVGRASDLI